MAGRISKKTIEAVQTTADIVQIIGEYTKLEPRGSDWWGCCPFHGEKTASFHVEPDKRFYYCFGCHAGGDVIKFLMEQEKLTYVQAIESLAKRYGIQVEYEDGYEVKEDPKFKLIQDYIELYERTAGMFHYMLTQTEQGKSALKYITDRGLSLETIDKFKLGYAPQDRKWLKDFLLKKNFSKEFLENSGLFSKKFPDIALYSNRLMFPIFNRDGKVVALGGRQLVNEPNSPKYLNSPDLIQYKKGETLYAFNFAKKSIKENKKVIFCEGYMDCIAYHQCGINYAVAPLGTALTEEQIKIIRPFVDEVLLSFDSDGAGQKATLRAILMLRASGLTCKVIRLEGGKDPAEIMINFGAETLTGYVLNAILDSDFLLSKLGKEYPIDTPEGKTKASLAFFPYIDALQSDIMKESCLEQLCQTFNLKPEAVKRDFQNREQARNRLKFQQPEKDESKNTSIKLTAELRSVLAIIAHIDKYNIVRNELTLQDFEDPSAQRLFSVLEECYQDGSLSLTGVLTHCKDESLSNLVTSVIATGEFNNDSEDLVQASVKMLKKRSLERQRDRVMARIRSLNVVTPDDQNQMNALLSEKMQIDKKLKS